MTLWSKLLRKVELFFKHVITITPFSMECGRPDTSKANFWCDSWNPPWPCVPCKRLRHFLKHRVMPGMMFIQTQKTRNHPRCWFWMNDRDPHTLTQQEKRNVGVHFGAAFGRFPWTIFQNAFARAFFGIDLRRLPKPPVEALA